MSRNYYYLIAGLPDISMDDTKTACSFEQFRVEYYPQLSSKDQTMVDLLILEQDNRNLLVLLADKDAALTTNGLYTADELLEAIHTAREEEKWDTSFPTYFCDYIRAIDSEEDSQMMAVDLLASYYYRHAAGVSNSFVSRWFRFNLDLNNILAAMTARKYRLPVAPVVVGEGEVAEALRTNSSRDFGLTGTYDRIEEIQHIAETANLVEREHKIDALRWNWLDEESFFNYFGIEKLFGFLVKNQIVERWMMLDANVGNEMLRFMIAQMKEVDVPADFKTK
jgi:hypothetical protein